jgi:hypothetical protein
MVADPEALIHSGSPIVFMRQMVAGKLRGNWTVNG